MTVFSVSEAGHERRTRPALEALRVIGHRRYDTVNPVRMPSE